MRVECEFRFYRQVFDKKGSYYYVLAGTSNRVTFDGGAEEPLQVIPFTPLIFGPPFIFLVRRCTKIKGGELCRGVNHYLEISRNQKSRTPLAEIPLKNKKSRIH